MKKPHILSILAVLTLVGVIVSPISALGYEITAEPLGGTLRTIEGKVSSASIDVSGDGEAIQRIAFDIGSGTTVNFTLTYGNGATVSGWMLYENDGFFTQHSEVAIDTDVSGYEYIGLQEIGRIDIVGYARNWTSDSEYTTGFIVYDSVFGVSERRAMAYYPVSAITDNVIYKFEITSNNPVAIAYYTNTRENVARAAALTPLEAGSDYIKLALQYAKSITDFLSGLFWLIKFFFVDNLLLIIALWISVTMAYSAISSKDVWGFYKKFFRLQRTLIDVMMALWTTLVSILNYLVQIFVKWL